MLFLTRKSGIVSLMRTDLSRGEKRKNYKYLGRVFQEERRVSRKALKRVHLAYQRNTKKPDQLEQKEWHRVTGVGMVPERTKWARANRPREL